MSNIKNQPFLGVSCKREFRTCQGIKMCKFASNQIIEGIHTEVDFDNKYYKELFNQEDYNSHEFALCQFVTAYKSPCISINSIQILIVMEIQF
ncbi:7866_t:CDS:2 [Funneliformis geosporum]|uniref:7866_t:CDS:1 n=1 Tax=Funneliformis geosporum TaxID=1117311 RepID=A0A9W4SHC3_9GLOM|nr:7866_t:CDS:2 [Funneliformis geosporum]